MNIDTILNECKKNGFVVLVKNTNRDIRLAILEAEGRGYLHKTQPGVYRLTPAGYGFLDDLERKSLLEPTYKPHKVPAPQATNANGKEHTNHSPKLFKINGYVNLASGIITIIIGIITFLLLFF